MEIKDMSNFDLKYVLIEAILLDNNTYIGVFGDGHTKVLTEPSFFNYFLIQFFPIGVN